MLQLRSEIFCWWWGLLIAAALIAAGCGQRLPLDADIDAAVPLDAQALLGSQGVVLPPATYMMGTPDRDPCKINSWVDAYTRVTLTRSFEIQTHETTGGDYASLVPGSKASRANWPAVVTWSEALHYCNALSDKYGLERCYTCRRATLVPWECETRIDLSSILDCGGFRLPTSAEWEYAARAGTTTAYYQGDWRPCEEQGDVVDRIAWYSANSSKSFHPVGEKEPNAWGLYDTLGNVSEMTYRALPWKMLYDFYPDRAVDPVIDYVGNLFWTRRGGGALDRLPQVRVSSRTHIDFEDVHGFRVVRTVAGP
ncbi:MAG: formylglycine-generating enzyme family protein [Deltaproteobacteria bacterium]|nr:formylglycine-generating enzyme family protein [Deltaproteobacteria bacterium]